MVLGVGAGSGSKGVCGWVGWGVREGGVREGKKQPTHSHYLLGLLARP